MNLTITGHDDRYAVEQLQMSLFPGLGEGSAVSKLSRGAVWLTATATIELNGKRTHAVRRLRASEETVRLRRRALQQSFYLAALPHLKEVPAWGALAGVRPTKISTKHLLEGGTLKSADKLLRDVYFAGQRQADDPRQRCAVYFDNANVQTFTVQDIQTGNGHTALFAGSGQGQVKVSGVHKRWGDIPTNGCTGDLQITEV